MSTFYILHCRNVSNTRHTRAVSLTEKNKKFKKRFTALMEYLLGKNVLHFLFFFEYVPSKVFQIITIRSREVNAYPAVQPPPNRSSPYRLRVCHPKSGARGNRILSLGELNSSKCKQTSRDQHIEKGAKKKKKQGHACHSFRGGQVRISCVRGKKKNVQKREKTYTFLPKHV